MDRLIPTVVAIAGVLFVASLSLFTVDQRQYALVFQFGEVVRIIRSRAYSSRCRCCRTCVISIAGYRP